MVTVIIPTYKRAKYITRAIDSVLNQTYKDLEIIVVDDNNPNTEERKELEKVMERYINNSKVIYIQHEKNKNVAAARNTAIKIAHGEYISFLDDDDFYLKNRLEVLVKLLKNNPEYSSVYSSGIILNNKIFTAELSGNLQKEILNQRSFLGTGSNMFFRTKVIKELGGFDESLERHEDLEFMVRFFRKYKILAVNQILVVKDNSDRKNNPIIKNAINIREKFLKSVMEDINQYEDKNDIIQNNYISLLFSVSKLTNKEEYTYLKNKSLEYGKISTKLQCKILIYGILHKEIKIIKKLFFKLEFNKLDKEILEEIENILC